VSVVLVRTSIAVRDGWTGRRRRGLDERLALRFPGLARRLARLPSHPGSRVRRAALVHGVRVGFAATNRRDFESLLARYHPDAETHHHPDSHELIHEPLLRGREGVVRFFEQWLETWDDVRYEPVELLDPGGERFMVLSQIAATGRGSGVPVRQPFAQLFQLKDGLIVRVDAWLGPWNDAIEGLGLAKPAEATDT
jgi:ketosteroid isomerase-like protein